MEQKQIFAAFEIAFDRFRLFFVGKRQTAGICDHVENEQVALIDKVEFGECAPVIFPENHVAVRIPDALELVASGIRFVVVICNKELHFANFSLICCL
jgi:hypothetical protein